MIDESTILFQSTLPREERPTSGSCGALVRVFQSTLPREERPFSCINSIINVLFQSTLPREERHPVACLNLIIIISIHAPTRGATDLGLSTIQPFLYFNPRSHERSDDSLRSNTFSSIIISIHAPTRGATLYNFHCVPFALFQSTLPREERPFLSFWVFAGLHISIHAPTRGAT